MNSTLECILLIFGVCAGHALVDWLFRGRFRRNFAIGYAVIAIALSAIVTLCACSPEEHYGKVKTIIVLGMLALCCIGSIVIDNVNISEQENRRMSRWGSWWDGFEDNYVSNIIDKWETYAVLAFLLFCMGSMILKPEEVSAETHSPAIAKSTQASHKRSGRKSPAKPAHTTRRKSAKHVSLAHQPAHN